jgi:Planctomycete cytochrome C
LLTEIFSMPFRQPAKIVGALILTLVTLSATAAGGAAADHSATEHAAADIAFFETKIRPVLVEKCYSCHSGEAEKLQAGLLLDSREGLLRGGDSGPAVISGSPAESLLIQSLKYEAYEMPPAGQLPAAVIADF